MLVEDQRIGGNVEGDGQPLHASERLMAEGFACYRIEFPKGMGANTYTLKVGPAARSLGLLIRKAAWLGQGRAPAPTSTSVEVEDDMPPEGLPEPLEAMAGPTGASPTPEPPIDDPVLSQTEQEVVLLLDDRRYRVRGWKKPLNPESLKINLLVQRGERFHVDTLDLYSAKARAGFAKQAGIELGEADEPLKHDLGRVLLKVEALQDSVIVQASQKVERAVLSEAERDEALDLLKAPDLVDRILADFAACGMVGEAPHAPAAQPTGNPDLDHHRWAGLLRRSVPGTGPERPASARPITRQQPRRKRAPADPATGAKDAALQIPGFGSAVPDHSCGGLKHLLHPTPLDPPPNPSAVPWPSHVRLE